MPIKTTGTTSVARAASPQVVTRSKVVSTLALPVAPFATPAAPTPALDVFDTTAAPGRGPPGLPGPAGPQVTTLAELATLHDGLAFVRDLRAYFTFDAQSSAPLDDVTVVAGATEGRWVRLDIPHPAWQAQTTWHINEVSGSNLNDGLSGGTAIAHWDELVRRVGRRWRVNTRIDIYVDSDITHAHVSLSLGPNGLVFVHGLRTVTGTGTISAFSPDPHTGEATLVTDTARTWVPMDRVHVTSGANAGAAMWVAKDKTGGVGRMSPPVTCDPVVDPFNTQEVVLSPGDGYQITTLPVITTMMLDLDGGAGVQQNESYVIFLDCDLPRLGVPSDQPAVFVGCRFHFLETSGGESLTDCCLTGLLFSLVNGASNAGLFINLFMTVYGVWFFNQHPILQNTAPVMKSGAVLYFEDYAGFFDVANPLTLTYGAKIYARHGLYGTGITGAVIDVQPGAQFRYSSTVFSFAGQTNDVKLGGRAATPRINPTTNVSDGIPLLTSFVNLALAFGSGGFGGSAHDLYSNASFLAVPDTTI